MSAKPIAYAPPVPLTPIPIAEDWIWKFPCRLIRNYDGDSIVIEIDRGFGGRLKKTVRLHGVDTPELRGGTLATKALGRMARDHVTAFICTGTSVIFQSNMWNEKYGRALGDLVVDGKSLSEDLLERRMAVQYDGGNRAAMQMLHEKNARFVHNLLGIALPGDPSD